MKVRFLAPSYKRPEKSVTQTNYPMVTLVVAKKEGKAYLDGGNHIIECPDKVQGNLCRVRNWMIDNLMEDNDALILMDDDCRSVGRWENARKVKFNPEELIEFAEVHTALCRELGFKFWGVNCVTDKGAYREYTPFAFTSYIGGPFQVHLSGSTLRYDEELPLKEDYDMTLQHLITYGGCLRVNFAHYDVKQAEQEGGCATYRNLEREKEQFWSLMRKWGKDVIRRDKSSVRSFDFNPIMKSPIKGV